MSRENRRKKQGKMHEREGKCIFPVTTFSGVKVPKDEQFIYYP